MSVNRREGGYLHDKLTEKRLLLYIYCLHQAALLSVKDNDVRFKSSVPKTVRGTPRRGRST